MYLSRIRALHSRHLLPERTESDCVLSDLRDHHRYLGMQAVLSAPCYDQSSIHTYYHCTSMRRQFISVGHEAVQNSEFFLIRTTAEEAALIS